MGKALVLQNASYPEKEIADALPGDVIIIKDEHDMCWDGFYASGLGYVVKRSGNFTLPSGKLVYQGPVVRIIPHPEGPIIETTPGQYIQGTKTLNAPNGVGILLPHHSPAIDRVGGKLTISSGAPGSAVVDFTKLTGVIEYHYIEAHSRGLLVGVDNTVYLAVTEPLTAVQYVEKKSV